MAGGDMYRQRAADAKQRAVQAKDHPPIKIAFEHEAAFWLGLAEQLDWTGTFSGLSLETANGEQCTPSKDMLPHSPPQQGRTRSATSADPY